MQKTLIIVTLIIVTGCRKSPEVIHPLPEYTEKWEVRGGKYADKPILLRINRGLDSIAANESLMYQAAASVPFKRPLKSGLLDTSEVEALKKIEKILTYRLVNSGLAVFGLKVETDNRCDFIFYTDNKEAVGKVFRHIGTLIQDYKIDFTIKRDKKWITYKWFSTWE